MAGCGRFVAGGNDDGLAIVGVLEQQRTHPRLPQRLEQRHLVRRGGPREAARKQHGDARIGRHAVEACRHGRRSAVIDAREAQLALERNAEGEEAAAIDASWEPWSQVDVAPLIERFIRGPAKQP